MTSIATPPPPRLSILFAREARQAVVFRRGPSTRVRLILWDLGTDTITRGQWLSGSVDVDKSDVSPDGKLLVYFARKFATKLGTFTAISRPPYYTALALWPDGGTWGGGGRFVSNRKVVLGYGGSQRELHEGVNIPKRFEVSDLYRESGERVQRLGASQWETVQRGSQGQWGDGLARLTYREPWIFECPSPNRSGLVLRRTLDGLSQGQGPREVHRFALTRRGARGEELHELGDLAWAEWDEDGSLLYADKGCLFRIRRPSSDAGLSGPPSLVADFCGDTHSSIVSPPEARRWPKF